MYGAMIGFEVLKNKDYKVSVLRYSVEYYK